MAGSVPRQGVRLVCPWSYTPPGGLSPLGYEALEVLQPRCVVCVYRCCLYLPLLRCLPDQKRPAAVSECLPPPAVVGVWVVGRFFFFAFCRAWCGQAAAASMDTVCGSAGWGPIFLVRRVVNTHGFRR